MNQFTLLVIILVVFTYYGGSNVPKVLKDNKELLLGVVGGLVLCSFLGMRLEGVENIEKRPRVNYSTCNDNDVRVTNLSADFKDASTKDICFNFFKYYLDDVNDPQIRSPPIKDNEGAQINWDETNVNDIKNKLCDSNQLKSDPYHPNNYYGDQFYETPYFNEQVNPENKNLSELCSGFCNHTACTILGVNAAKASVESEAPP